MKFKRLTGAVTLAALAMPGAIQAQDAKREPAAMQALDAMGASLRTLTDFRVHADLTVEDVLLNGQKIQYGGTIEIAASRPNRFRIDLTINDVQRKLFYNGQSLTLYSPGLQYYATATAPANIRDTLDAAYEQYGLDIPIADLFMWGENPDFADSVEEAFYVGDETILAQQCHHYAMRQATVDWQLWIRDGTDGDVHLPCKLVITDRTDPSLPQVTLLYRWESLAPSLTDDFNFIPPAGARPIVYDALRATGHQDGEQP